MAVGVRSQASTGSYGAGVNSTLAVGRLAQPDFFGGRQGSVYIDYRKTDEANGYKFDKNGRALGSGKNGYETAAERAERMMKREASVRKFTNAIRGSANQKQYQGNNRATYNKAYQEAIDRGLSPRQAAVVARRTVNQREQERLTRAAKKAGVGIKRFTQR